MTEMVLVSLGVLQATKCLVSRVAPSYRGLNTCNIHAKVCLRYPMRNIYRESRTIMLVSIQAATLDGTQQLQLAANFVF